MNYLTVWCHLSQFCFWLCREGQELERIIEDSLPNFHKSPYSNFAVRPFWFWNLIMKKHRLILSYRSPYGMLENFWLSLQKKKEKNTTAAARNIIVVVIITFFYQNADINVVIKIENTWSRCLCCWILCYAYFKLQGGRRTFHKSTKWLAGAI